MVPAAAGSVASHAFTRPVPIRWRWLAIGTVLQAFVLLVDSLTPLGFADGVLYALPVALGSVARSHRAIWLLCVMGIVGVLLGISVSDGRLHGVTDSTIWLNRCLGIGWVLVGGVVASIVLRLLLHRDATHQDLERNVALMEVSSRVGRLGGWNVDLEGRDVRWSNTVFRLLDHPVGRLGALGELMEMYAPLDRTRILAAFDRCATDGTMFDEHVQLVHAGGEGRWLRVVGEAVRNPEGRIVRVQGALQDIEARMQSELALERSRAEWRLMTESLPMMVWVGGVDGLMSYFNRYTVEYVGAELTDLLGAAWLQFVHPEDQADTVALWQMSLTFGAPYEAEFRVRRADGEWRWHLARAVRVDLPTGQRAWYGTAMDSQMLRDEREARARLAERLVETMESVGDAIFTLDRDWCFRYLNGHAELVLERKRADLLGRNVWDEFPAARGSEFQQQYERCVRDRIRVRFQAEFGPLGKLFEVTAYPVEDGLAVYFHDVTEERRLAEQLEQVQRMDSLGQLTGGVAHDFNNLLTVILGNAELLAEAETGELPPQAREMVEMIGNAARRGAEMTQRLLTFARKQTLEPEPTDLNLLLRQRASMLERALGEQVRLTQVPGEALWPAMVDTGRLEAALLNMAVNARHAMPGGGTFTLATSNVVLDEDDAAQHIGLRAGDYVMLAVSDDGNGMLPAVLARVFEPFFTTKEVGQGTGLGLAMVYGFARQSHGHVAIESQVGCGTTIRLYLPRASERHPAASPTVPARAMPRSAQGERILLVEDDDMVRAFSRSQVALLGYRVLEASSGPQALALLAAHPDVALLFTDVVMSGGMSGVQLAEAARALRPGLPVLYTSGYTENAISDEELVEGNALLLGKPFDRAALADKLQQALNRGNPQTIPGAQ